MKRLVLLYILLLLGCLQVWCQQVTRQCHVADAATGEALSYVSVYISAKNTTVSNHDGDFMVIADSMDMVQLSYVGYDKVMIRAGELPEVIQMKVQTHVLHQVTIMPTATILSKVLKKLQSDYKKNSKKKGQYFCRLNSKIGEKEELIEAFLEAKNAVNLRELSIQSGRRGQMTRYGMLRPQLDDINLQHTLELGPITFDIPFWSRHALIFPRGGYPLDAYYKDYYDISCEVVNDGMDDKCYCIEFRKSAKTKRKGMMLGKLYVDAATFQPLQFEGEVTDMYIDMYRNKKYETNPAEVKVHINFSQNTKYTEVEDISCEITSKGIRTQSILHNVSGLDLTFEKKKNSQVKDNMLSAIDAAGFDSTLWKHAGIVHRTPYEEYLAQQQAQLDSTANQQHTGNDKLDAMVDRLRLFGLRIPQEKVFLHMDNSCYFLGDTIWFAAYTRRTSDNLPSDISNILYVELLNNDGYVMERKVVKMENGRGHGEFYLDPEYYSGFYELRAYTRWQLNWGEFERDHCDDAKYWFRSNAKLREFYRDYDKLYSRVVPVYDAPTDSTSFFHDMTLRPMRRYFKKDPTKREINLAFFPEGGELVQGLPNRMAFEARWDDGEWVEGELQMDSMRTATIHRGRGIMTLTPDDAAKLHPVFITSSGKKIKGKLPEIQQTGVALRVNAEENRKWIMDISMTNDLEPDSMAMTIMYQGVLKKVYALKKRNERIELSGYQLENGVNQVTVFDTDGRVWADRLFFVNNGNISTSTLSINGVKDEYRPFERITLDIQADDVTYASSQPLSLAVRDAMNQDYLYDNSSLLTEMLLSSEIKGFVPQPGWYFEKEDEEHRQALDLLMMTQGWRRFVWRDMAVRGEWDLVHPDEKSLVIEGTVEKFISEEELNAVTGSDEPFPNEESVEVDASSIRQEDGYRTTLSDLVNQLGGNKKLKKEVRLHSEIVELLNYSAIAHEEETRNGRFRIKLPDFYLKSVLFMSAADTTKWKPKTKYKWVQTASDYNQAMKGHAWTYELDIPEYMPYLSQPYPRYAKPYTWHQRNLAPAPKREGMRGRRLGDNTVQLTEVAITAKRNGQRRFKDSEPAFIVDAYDAYNNALDAGLRPDPEGLVRSYIGDMGMMNPYATEIDISGEIAKSERSSRIFVSYGANQLSRFELGEISEDSLYLKKNLSSTRKELDRGEQLLYYKEGAHGEPTSELDFSKLDKFVIYTDYCPRLIGDPRYEASNLPETRIALYPYADGTRRPFYRDRRYIIDGFSVPNEFYNPDYSKQNLPELKPADHRRTLYWNPDLKLDESGHAQVTLYNCERTTSLNITAEGLTEEGQILTGSVEN